MRKGFLSFMVVLFIIFALPISAVAAETNDDNTTKEICSEWVCIDIPTSTTEQVIDFTPETKGKFSIIPYANPTDLVYEEGRVIFEKSIVYSVTPTKGRSLRIWLKPFDNPVTITVKKSGAWFNSYSHKFSTDQDVEAVSSCDGGTYTITASGTLGSIYSILIYETGG